MNNVRRRILKNCVLQLQSYTEDACSVGMDILEDVLDEENECRDCMPDGLDCTDNYYASEAASEAMETAIDNLETASTCFVEEDLAMARKVVDEAIRNLLDIQGVG